MKLFTAAQFFIAVCTALPSAKLDEWEHNVASRDISASLATTVGFACSLLNQFLSTETLFPGSANYSDESTAYWSSTDYLAPACILTPQSAIEVSLAILIISSLKVPFAIRGGGHMPISGYANTNGGVLIGLTKLNQIQLAANQSYVSVGPGNRWEDVYKYLEPYGLIALGGRVGNVGVPGLLLGGGISFYSNQYGFSADNVIAYEVVLASGQIVTATATQYSDLFWALKGGGNSFGIVTRFDLSTYSSPKICAGIIEVPETEKDTFLNAVANFAQFGALDAKAAVIPSTILLASINLTVFTSALFYDAATCDQPALKNLSSLPAIMNTYGPTTLAAYTASTDALTKSGTRQEFQVLSSFATLAALQIIYPIFTSMVRSKIWDVAGLQASITFQPVTKNFIQQGIIKGGNPQGVDVTKAPYFWMVENFSWTNASDDDRIYDFCNEVTEAINDALAHVHQKATYLYMNDAGLGQKIFQNYGPGNLEKLRSIRSKYDPEKVYTELESGGWKLPG